MATVQDEMERMQTIADRMRAQIKVLEVDAEEKQKELDAKQQELDDVKEDAEKKNRLTAMLLENNRTEDLLKAVNDPAIRQRLMEELL